MDVTSESLREKFRMLNDAELLDLFQSGDLTDLARGVALAELRQRGIDPKKPKQVPAPEDIPTDATQDELDPELWAGSSGDLVLVGRFLTPAEAYVVQSRLAVEGGAGAGCRYPRRSEHPVGIGSARRGARPCAGIPRRSGAQDLAGGRER